MTPIYLKELQALHPIKTELSPDTVFSGLSIDSRSLSKGELFFALPGEHVDGHRFLDAVLEKGGIPVVKREHPKALSRRMLLVEDPEALLLTVARLIREKFQGKVIAITGSLGKTTVKDMTAVALSPFGKVASTLGNFNNHLGLPLTLGKTDGDEDFLVLELGMSHPGELSMLTGLAKPELGLVTCAAPAHLAFFSSVDAIADAKAELYEALEDDALMIANADDERMLKRAKALGKPFTFGESQGADVQILASSQASKQLEVKLKLKEETKTASLQILGQHHAKNVAASLAIVAALGLNVDASIEALSKHFKTPPHRMELHEFGELKVIDDAYNASPESMKAALLALRELAGDDKKVALLGSMMELGETADALHEETASYALGFEAVFALGPHREALKAGALRGDVKQVFTAETLEALEEGLRQYQGQDAWLLLKGSRSMRLERALPFFQEPEGEPT